MVENTTWPKPQLVRELMTVGVATCPPQTPLEELARLMLEREVEAVVVLDDQGHAAGIVSQDELVRTFAQGEIDGLTAGDIMDDGVPQIPPDIPLTAAAQIMQDYGRRALFLMHHAGGIEYPAAVISYRHLLRLIAAQDETDLRDLGIKAARESPLATFIRQRDAARRRA